MKTKEKHIRNIVKGLIPFKTCKGINCKEVQLKLLSLQWLENIKLRIKESSYVKYYNIVHGHIISELGEWRMEEITTELVEQFIQGKLEHGRKDGTGGLSEKTVKDILTVLKEICLYAINFDIKVPCHFELIKIRCNNMEVEALDKKNYIQLAKFLLKDNSLKKTGILLSLYMGLRLGEVCALRRQHILYKEEILCVRATMQRIQDLSKEGNKRTKIIVTVPKSNSSIRDIPIPSFLMERLEELRGLPEDAYILTGSSERFIEPRTLENILKSYLRECNIAQVNYHVLRHTFATRCMEEGFDAKSLSEILGHSSVNITLNRYVHSSMEQKRRNMGKIYPYTTETVL